MRARERTSPRRKADARAVEHRPVDVPSESFAAADTPAQGAHHDRSHPPGRRFGRCRRRRARRDDRPSRGGRPVRINPTTWNVGFPYDQAQLRPAPTQLLTLAGQCSIDEDGALQHAGDMAGQMTLALQNVADLLARGGMTLRDVTRLVVYVTDMGAALASYAALVEQLAAAGATPPATLVEVARLAVPGMTVEIDATAGR